MRGLRAAALWIVVLACASAKAPDNVQAIDAAKSVDAGVRNDAATHPTDAPSGHHDAAVSTPDAFVSPDADTSGAICTANNQCTTTGQCCLIIAGGVGVCATGTIFNGTCL